MKEVEKLEVIRTYLLSRGKGTDSDPMRMVLQYWSLDGELLAEIDPVRDNSPEAHKPLP